MATPEAAQRVRSVIERLERAGTIIAELDGSDHDVRITGIPPAEGAALRDWVLREQPARTIEIGLGYGMSTLYICEGLLLGANPDAKHLALDPAQEWRFRNCGLQALEEAGVRGLVEHVPQLSQWLLPKMWEERRQFDFGFVDGNHRFDYVFLDLFYLDKLVKRGGVIMLDDYNLPGIAKAAAFWVANLGWTVEDVASDEHDGRWAVLRTSPDEDKRDFRHFVDF